MMAKAILLQERAALKIRLTYRSQLLETAPLHEKVSMLLSMISRELGTTDAHKHEALALHTRKLLQFSGVKAKMALYLVFQAQVERLAQITQALGNVERELFSKDTVGTMTTQELIILQKSLHQQQDDLTNFLKDASNSVDMDTLLNSLDPTSKANVSIKLGEIPASSRDKVRKTVQAMLMLKDAQLGQATVELLPPEKPKRTQGPKGRFMKKNA